MGDNTKWVTIHIIPYIYHEINVFVVDRRYKLRDCLCKHLILSTIACDFLTFSTQKLMVVVLYTTYF